MRLLLLQIVVALALIGLLGIGISGCHPGADGATTPGSANDFPPGAAVYVISNHAYTGHVINYEAQHTFPDGTVAEGVLMQGTDGQAGWYHAASLRKSFTTH